MAWSLLLRVGDTSASDIILTASPVGVTEYPLNAPMVNQDAIQNLGDGNSLTVPSFANVVESIDIHIQAGTPALVRDQVRAIERLLDLARQGSLGYLADKVYLCIQFDADSEYWRSQILAASYAGAQATNQIWRNFTTGTIALTRRFYWETTTLHAVALTSGPTYPVTTTGYTTVYNADDTHATNRNWFELAGDQVQGSIPAPAKLSIKNNSGSAKHATTVYLGNYVYANPSSVDPIFRGDQAAGGFASATTTEGELAYWSLAGDNLTDAFKGQFGRLLAVYSDRPAVTTLMRFCMQYRFPVPTLDLALGDQHLNATVDFVQDLGALPIPPGGNWTDSSSKLYVAIKGRTPSGSDSIAIDFIQLMPSTAGRYRVLKGLVSLNLGNGDELIDDGPEGAVYVLEGGANRQPLYRPFFEPIYLWPNQPQRLRLIISSGSFAMELGQAWQVKAEIRYRRLTL